MAIFKITLMFLALFVVSTMLSSQGEAVECGPVQAALKPCLDYLNAGGEPGSACCDGIKSLKALATTTAERRAVCACAKEAAAKLPTSIDANAALLPDKCNAPIGFPISRNIDCNSVN